MATKLQVWKPDYNYTLFFSLSLSLPASSLYAGVVGILRAGEINTCDQARPNVTECQVIVDLTTMGSGGGQDVTGQAGRSLEFVWWLLGSSGCGLVFSLVFMLAVWILIEVIRWFQICEEDEKKLRGIKCVECLYSSVYPLIIILPLPLQVEHSCSSDSDRNT